LKDSNHQNSLKKKYLLLTLTPVSIEEIEFVVLKLSKRKPLAWMVPLVNPKEH
jgi:hypothetical protein